MAQTANDTRIDIPALLLRLPLFHALTPEQIAHVSAHTRGKRLPKGEMLFQKGDLAHGFYVIVFGQVKLAFPSSSGNEKVIEIIGPKQSFGEAVMFMDRPYPVFAESLADSLLLHIASQAVFEMLETDASFARRMLAGLALRLHGLIRDVESYSLRSSTQRVIGFLLQRADNGDTGGHDVEIDGERRFGNGRLLPAGPLREPAERLGLIDVVIVNGGPTAPGEIPLVVTGRTATSLREPGRLVDLRGWQGRRVHAVAGIGNPERFFRMLEGLGLAVIRHPLPDHHDYVGGELDFGDGLPVLVTEKDAVKCAGLAGPETYAVPVEAGLPVELADRIHVALHQLPRARS